MFLFITTILQSNTIWTIQERTINGEACDNLGEKINPRRILEGNPKREEHLGRLKYKEDIELTRVLKK